jgi:S-adenosylmethionine hydrolase
MIITLTTDFGLEDSYAAEMKAVILAIAPAARLVDVSHRVAPHDVFGAAFLLDRAAPWFPAGTVHVAVVDPGVGTARRAIAVRTRDASLVGPDNGIFEPFLARGAAEEIREISDPRYRLESGAAVFEGRDRFAPAAAYLARGVDPAEFGPRISDPLRLRWPEPVSTDRAVEGEVLAVDAFGSLVTNIPAALLEEGMTVFLEGREVGPVVVAYAGVAPGQALALAGSAGLLEIAVREGRADVRLAAGRGSRVHAVRRGMLPPG